MDERMQAQIEGVRKSIEEISHAIPLSFEEPLETQRKGISGKLVLMIKRIVRKCTRFLLAPYADKSFLSLNKVCATMEELLDTIEEAHELDRATQEALLATVSETQEQHIRMCIQQRLNVYGSLDSLRFDDYDFCCPVCGHVLNTGSAVQHETTCIFLGGKLIRHECDNCGAIVGPLKVLMLTQEELDLDYQQHYSIYSEGDTTEQEKMAFFQLQPEKGKTYLNFGCGAWSRSLQELRDDGWDIYGYEPYSNTSEVPYLITSRDILSTMRFDGIISNNVLEHLRNPLEDLLFMKKILRDSESIMVHSTPCYEYLYEFTRFHVVFFTGNSIHVLAKAAGLEAYDRFETVIEKSPCITYKMRVIG